MDPMGSSASRGAEQERIVDAFEAVWRAGQQPRLEDFLPEHPDLRSVVLLELVRADLEIRTKRGEPASVHDYLARYPDLKADRLAVVDLIRSEFRWRKQRDQAITWLEYLSTYPDYQEELFAVAAEEAAAG